MNLTTNFTLEELIRSDYATRKSIDNTPPADLFANLQMLAAGLERVRGVLAVPIRVTSGYRSPKLNSAVNGSRSSMHMAGLAADFIAPAFGTPAEIVTKLMASRQFINYDQCILEFNDWVHIGFADIPRLETLKYDGKTYTRL